MTTAIILALSLIRPLDAYSAIEIPHLPKMETFGKVLLTDSGMVSGYWYEHIPPGHSGAIDAAPFVWKNGKLIALPLGSHEHGHVLGGDDQILVGDVELDYKWLPAMWTPDPKFGWEKAALQVLSKRPGLAKCVATDGTIWGDNEDGIWSWKAGEFKEFKIGKYDLIGIDKNGVVYLNNVNENLFANEPELKVFRYSGGKLTSISPEGAKQSRFKAVNSNGVAVGSVYAERNIAAKWVDGRMVALSFNKEGYSTTEGINESGDAVGAVTYRDELKATLWKSDKLFDISSAVPNRRLIMAKAINSKGQIVAINDEWLKEKLYLLTPKD